LRLDSKDSDDSSQFKFGGPARAAAAVTDDALAYRMRIENLKLHLDRAIKAVFAGTIHTC
jgi:hypothetical protein